MAFLVCGTPLFVMLALQTLIVVGIGVRGLDQRVPPPRLVVPALAFASMITLLTLVGWLAVSGVFGGYRPDPGWWEWGGTMALGAVTWTGSFLWIWFWVHGRQRLEILKRIPRVLLAAASAETALAATAMLCWMAGYLNQRAPQYDFTDVGATIGVAIGLYGVLAAVGAITVVYCLPSHYGLEETEPEDLCPSCGRDVTITLKAGRTRCPECGAGLLALDDADQGP